MHKQNTLARSLHDIGLAAWFGGNLMGAIGLNGASEEVRDRRERIHVANAGWGRWQPVGAVAVAAHLLGSLQLTRANKARIAGQRGVASTAGVKTAVTAAALGATAYSAYLGQRIIQAEQDAAQFGGGVPAEDATTPAPQTPPEVADAQRQQKLLQWAVPALTGTLLVLNAKMGEQQRPVAVAKGLLERFDPRA